MTARLKVLVVDNYDSFTYNIVHYLGVLGADPTVARNDVLPPSEAAQMGFDRLVIFPGPGPARRRRLLDRVPAHTRYRDTDP